MLITGVRPAFSKTFTLPNNQYTAQFTQGADFYSKHYQPQSASSSTLSSSSTLCSGQFVMPLGWQDQLTTSKNRINDQSPTVIEADRGYYNPQGESQLEGNVRIQQANRQIQAQQVTLDADQVHAKATGQVEFVQDGILTQSDQVNYNLATQTGTVQQSFYISPSQQAHGYAARIERRDAQTVALSQVTFSTCSPVAVPAWHFEADQLILDENKGRGISKNTTFYVKRFPLLQIPYFNFPIDNRRSSGFLVPSIGYTNNGGLQLSVPYYLNLAPHYDLTVTPRYINQHGFMLEGDFGYLTAQRGQGKIWGSYLAHDDRYNGADRKDLHWLHQWNIRPELTLNTDWNYVSDKDFFTDLSNSPDSQDDVYQPRTVTLDYRSDNRKLNAQLKVQTFQVLDQRIADIDRPYARLPQLLIDYQDSISNGLNYGFTHDSAYFRKNLDDRVNVPKYPSGLRIYNDLYAQYVYHTPWLWVVPQVNVRNLNIVYDRNYADATGADSASLTRSVVVPQVSVDMLALLEKSGTYLQTLTPRLFYVYSPYRNQQQFPNFDSTNASMNYDQLFNPSRFYGHDRLDDNHFVSLGLTYRLYDTIGLERLRAALGQSFYFSDRKVTLRDYDPIATNRTSGPILNLSSQLSNNTNVNATLAWQSNGKSAFNALTANYGDEQGRLYSLGYYQRSAIAQTRQQSYQQVALGFVHPLRNNWRILGQSQYDIDQHFVREWLLGANYQSCCWGVSLYGRSYYNDLDDPKTQIIAPKRMIMAEFSLKGLGGLSGKLASLLENRMIGFDQSSQPWVTR